MVDTSVDFVNFGFGSDLGKKGHNSIALNKSYKW